MSVSSLDNGSIFYSRTQKPHKTNPYLSMSPKMQQNSQNQSEHACVQNQKKFRATEPNKTALRAQPNYKYKHSKKAEQILWLTHEQQKINSSAPYFSVPDLPAPKWTCNTPLAALDYSLCFFCIFTVEFDSLYYTYIYIINSAVFFHFIFTLCIVCHIPSDLTNQTWWHHAKLKHLVSRCRNLSPCGIIYCSCSLRVNQNDSQVRVSGTARVAATLLTSNQQRARPIFTASPLHPFNSPLDKGNFKCL